MIGRADDDTASAMRSVTGGTRGIGLGIARALARDGLDARLVRPPLARRVADVVKELASLGGGAEYWAADIGSPNDRPNCCPRSSRISARCTRS